MRQAAQHGDGEELMVRQGLANIRATFRHIGSTGGGTLALSQLGAFRFRHILPPPYLANISSATIRHRCKTLLPAFLPLPPPSANTKAIPQISPLLDRS